MRVGGTRSTKSGEDIGSYLNEILALRLGDERLELGGGEGVNQAGLGDDQQQNLRAGQDRQFIGLERVGEWWWKGPRHVSA